MGNTNIQETNTNIDNTNRQYTKLQIQTAELPSLPI